MEIQDEQEGEEFLNLDVGTLTFTHQIKSVITNVTGHHGATKPKQRSEAYRRMKINELLNIITFAAKLTKNSEESAACPIAVETIRGYDLKAKNYELPPYHVGETRSNTLHVQFVNTVGKVYDKYCTNAEAEVERHGLGHYMESTSWKETLEPLLAEITRYCIKFWHLHPHYNRKAAVDAALEHFEAHYQKKGDTKKIIDVLLESKRLEGITEDLLALDTETVTYDGTEKTVFKENDSAQTIITQFLHMKKFKWDKKNTLDMIQALHEYMNQASNIEKHKLRQFAGMVPKRTATYLDKVSKVEKAKEAEERKRVAREEREAKQAEAKRQKLEEKQKMIEEMQREKEQREKEQEEDDFDTSSGNPAGTINFFKDKEDEFAEYRLPSISHVIEEKKGGKARRTGSRLEVDANVGINKRLVKLHISEGRVEVVYSKPGGRWRAEMSQRLGSCMAALNAFALEEPALVNHYVVTSTQECGTQYSVSKKAGRILLAISMHVTAKKEADMEKFRVHPSVDEGVLAQDFQNTTALWCPGLYSSCLQNLDCLYDLCFSTSSGESPKDTFCDFLTAKFLVDTEWGVQVTQILDLVHMVQQYFDLGKVPDGATVPIDPFNTVSEIFDKDGKKTA